MKRFIYLTLVAAFIVAIPASHLMSGPKIRILGCEEFCGSQMRLCVRGGGAYECPGGDVQCCVDQLQLCLDGCRLAS